jgi:hypothetical protein
MRGHRHRRFLPVIAGKAMEMGYQKQPKERQFCTGKSRHFILQYRFNVLARLLDGDSIN